MYFLLEISFQPWQRLEMFQAGFTIHMILACTGCDSARIHTIKLTFSSGPPDKGYGKHVIHSFLLRITVAQQ